MWVRKHIKVQILHINNFNDNNNNKNNHDVHIIIDNYESDSDKLYKHSKN